MPVDTVSGMGNPGHKPPNRVDVYVLNMEKDANGSTNNISNNHGECSASTKKAISEIVDPNYHIYWSWSAKSIIKGVYVGDPTCFLVSEGVEDPIKKQEFSKEIESLKDHGDILKRNINNRSANIRTTLRYMDAWSKENPDHMKEEYLNKLADHKKSMEDGYKELESFVDRVGKSSYRGVGVGIDPRTVTATLKTMQQAQDALEKHDR